MADQPVGPENQKRRLSLSSSTQNWNVGVTEIHPSNNKAALKRGRNSSLNSPYPSGKSLHVEDGHYYEMNSTRSSQQQFDEDSMNSNSISITTNQAFSDMEAKVSAVRCHSAPRKKKSFSSDIESNNISQKLLGDSFKMKTLSSSSDSIDGHLYETLKIKLSALFYPDHGAYIGPQSSLSIQQMIHRSIFLMGPNPCKSTFNEISIRHKTSRESLSYPNFESNTSINKKNSDMSDDEVGEILVALITMIPDDMVSHQKILEALQKLNNMGNDWSRRIGINMISIATDALNKFRHEQIIQYHFTPFLKQGMNYYLQETLFNSRIDDEIDLSLKINRLTCLDYSKCDELIQVFMDGLGCNLKTTIIFKKAYAILQTKYLDQMMVAYQNSIARRDVISDFFSYLDSVTGKSGIDKIAQAGGLQVLLKIADLFIDNVDVEIIVFQHIKTIVQNHKPSRKKCPIEPIVRVMSKNIKSDKIFLYGCHILSTVGRYNPGIEFEVVEIVMKAVVHHPGHKRIIKIACSALSQIESPDNGFKMMDFLQELLESEKNDPEINNLILSAFAKITQKEIHVDTFVQRIAVDDVLAAQLRHGNDSEIQKQFCYITTNMLKYHKIEKRSALRSTQCVVDIIRRFSDNSSCQEAAFITLSYLSNQFIEEVLVCDVTGLVVMGMITHTDVPEIQESGCTILASLSVHTDIHQIGGIECILLAMAKHADRKRVQSAALIALSVLYEQSNQEAIDNTSTIEPLLEASRLSFPNECKEMVENILKVVNKHKVSTDSKNDLGGESLLIDIPVAPPYMLNDETVMNCSHKVFFVGGDEEIRQNTINQLVSDEKSACYALKKKRNNLGIIDYLWITRNESAGITAQPDLMLKIFDFSENGVPSLYFSQQATYIILWDIEKIFQTNSRFNMSQNNINDRIDENIIFWIDLIHEAAPHAQIYCIGVTKHSQTNLDPNKERYQLVRMRFEEVTFERMTKYGRSSRANVLFEFGSDNIIYHGGRVSSAIVSLRNRILISTENQQEADVFLYDPVAELSTKLVMSTVQEIGRKEVLLRWRQLLKSIKNIVKNNDSATDIALHMLAGNGQIRNFQVSLAPEERNEDIVLLNNEWLQNTTSCILQDNYENLKLSIEESKEDMFIHDIKEHVFCQVCIHCPVISYEDNIILWKSLESESSEDHDLDFAFQCLSQILTQLGILVPLQPNNKIPITNVYLIPSLLETGDPPNWSLKCSNMRNTIICSSWKIIGLHPRDFMIAIITSILRKLLTNLEQSRALKNPSNDQPIWCLPTDERIDHRDRIIIHEICCWKTSILVKVEIEELEKKKSKLKRGMVEVLTYLGGKHDSMTVGSNSLKDNEKRLSVTYKGHVRYVGRMGTTIYDSIMLSVERELSNQKDVIHRREIVCPDCLESYPIKDATVYEWEQVTGLNNGVLNCKKGHRLGISMFS